MPTLNDRRRESATRARWLQRVARAGGKALKTETLETGWPDELAILPGGLHVWAELKRPERGRMEARQGRNLVLLEALGCVAVLLSSPEAVDEFFDWIESWY